MGSLYWNNLIEGFQILFQKVQETQTSNNHILWYRDGGFTETSKFTKLENTCKMGQNVCNLIVKIKCNILQLKNT